MMGTSMRASFLHGCNYPWSIDGSTVSKGYAGAWGWSFSGSDQYGRLVPEALADFARRNPGLVNPRALL
jgi:hypothetical protein